MLESVIKIQPFARPSLKDLTVAIAISRTSEKPDLQVSGLLDVSCYNFASFCATREFLGVLKSSDNSTFSYVKNIEERSRKS